MVITPRLSTWDRIDRIQLAATLSLAQLDLIKGIRSSTRKTAASDSAPKEKGRAAPSNSSACWRTINEWEKEPRR